MSLRYNNQTDTKVNEHSFRYLPARYVTYKCRDMVESKTIHVILCLPGILSSNLFFLVSLYVSLILIGSPGFDMYP